MPQNEPTNEQLQALLTDPPALSRGEAQAEIYRLARALLAARETINEQKKKDMKEEK